MKNVLAVRELLELVPLAERPQTQVTADVARVLMLTPRIGDHFTRSDFPFVETWHHHIHAVVSECRHTCLALLDLLLDVGKGVLK